MTKPLTVTSDEISIVLSMAEDAQKALAVLAPDSDAHTSALMCQQWLEILLWQVTKRAVASPTPGQLRLL